MRAFGPGSISSFLKIILDVVFAALWIGAVVLALITVAALLLAFNPDLAGGIKVDVESGGESLQKFLANPTAIVAGLGAATLYVSGVLVIVGSLRRIFMTLTAGDPFHPDNVARLRLIGLMLAALELGRYVVQASAAFFLEGVSRDSEGLSLTAWFSVLVVFVLAEVFREGARLRREAELTI